MSSSQIIVILSIVVYLLPNIFIAWYIGRHRRMGFFWSLIVCMVTSPLFGFFIVTAAAPLHAKGCNWCGNSYNEAEFCGLCGKNDAGELRPGFVPKNK